MPDKDDQTQPKKPTVLGLDKQMREAAAATEDRLAGIEERMDGFDASIGEVSSKQDEMLSLLSGMSAQNRPTAPNTGIIEPMEMDQGSGEAQFDDSAADATLDLELTPGKDLDDPHLKAKLEYEAFMQEQVKVLIHDTNEEQADTVFEISVNGKRCVFARNQNNGQRAQEPQTVPRWAVEGLARAKPATYQNVEYVDPEGVRKVRYPMSRGVRYPFSVIHDPNPMGANWLASVLSQQ